MHTKDLTRTALMTAVLCILAPISIPLPVSSVALSLSTFAICLMAYILTPKQALTAVGIYLLLGAAGLPVFAGYLGGISRFASPVGGYLAGYLFLAGIGSPFVRKYTSLPMQFFGLSLGMSCLYASGILWMVHITEISFSAALHTGVLPFLPLDILKMLLAVSIGRKLKIHIK